MEDFDNDITEGVRCVYHFAIQQHKDSIIAHRQAQQLASTDPRNPEAKAMETEANKARIKLKGAESKAR